jgi:hypothetical protein
MLPHRQGHFFLDGAFVFIEGHPRYREEWKKTGKMAGATRAYSPIQTDAFRLSKREKDPDNQA